MLLRTACANLLVLVLTAGEVRSLWEDLGPYEIIIDNVEVCKFPGQDKLNIDFNITEQNHVKRVRTNWTWPYVVDGTSWTMGDLCKKSKTGYGGCIPYVADDFCETAMGNFGEFFENYLKAMGLPGECPIPAGTYSLDFEFRPFKFEILQLLVYGQYYIEFQFGRGEDDSREYYGCVRLYVSVYPERKKES